MLTLTLSAVSLLSLYGGVWCYRRRSHRHRVDERLVWQDFACWDASMTHRSSRFAG